jgi:hypothetical protein
VIWLRALTTAAVVVMLAGFAGAIVDYTSSNDRVPPEPNCDVSTAECGDLQGAWVERRLAVQSDFQERSWFYAIAVLVGALGLTGVSLLRARTPSDRQRVYANLGVGAVVLGLVVTAWFLLASRLTIEPAARTVYLPSLVMLALAALGGIVARGETGRPVAVDGRLRPRARDAAVIGLGFTVATFLLVWLGGEPSCPPEGGVVYGDVFRAAVATSIAAGVFGVLGLLARRWFVALVCLVVNPVLLFFVSLGCGLN